MAKAVPKPLLHEALAVLQQHVHISHVGSVPVESGFMRDGYADSSLSPVVLPTNGRTIILSKPTGSNSMYMPGSSNAAPAAAQRNGTTVVRARDSSVLVLPELAARSQCRHCC